MDQQSKGWDESVKSKFETSWCKLKVEFIQLRSKVEPIWPETKDETSQLWPKIEIRWLGRRSWQLDLGWRSRRVGSKKVDLGAKTRWVSLGLGSWRVDISQRWSCIINWRSSWVVPDQSSSWFILGQRLSQLDNGWQSRQVGQAKGRDGSKQGKSGDRSA